MKHEQDFNIFLRDHVNLNHARLERLNGHVNAVSDYLSANLQGYRSIEPQGSYALGTIIRPVQEDDDYDADLLLQVNLQSERQPATYIENLFTCFRRHRRYRDIAHLKTRCVELDYAGDVHIDVVPFISYGGTHYICNRITNEFEPTDGTGYRDWFNAKNELTGGNLKRVTRLLKYLRDHKQNFDIPSVLLTTMIGPTVDRTGDFSSVPTALHTVMRKMDAFLQDNIWMPAITNPVLPGEDFTRDWTQEEYDNFRETFHRYFVIVDTAYTEQSHDASIAKWRAVFGDGFGTLQVTNIGSRSVRPQRPWAQ